MKKICNQNFFSSYKFIFFFLIFQLFFINIKTNECERCKYVNGDEQCTPIISEDPPIDCEGCKPHLGNNNKCYDCSGITGFYIINNNECIEASNGCDYKIVEETKECVGHCSDGTFEMEDYCIFNCNSEINKPNNQLKICDCKYKYNINYVLNNKKRKKCLSQDAQCDYYDSDTHQCYENIEGCGNKKIKKIIVNEEKYQFRCSNECEKEEYTYKIDGQLYCDDDCIEGQTFYYNNSLSGINYCVDSCEDEKFYDDKEYTTQCKNNNANIIIDLSKDKEKKMFK